MNQTAFAKFQRAFEEDRRNLVAGIVAAEPGLDPTRVDDYGREHGLRALNQVLQVFADHKKFVALFAATPV